MKQCEHSREYQHTENGVIFGDPFTVKMEAFFKDICGTGGSIPDCTGCADHVNGMGCINTAHPMNIALEEVAQ